MNVRESYIIDGVRTPIGTKSGIRNQPNTFQTQNRNPANIKIYVVVRQKNIEK